MSSRRRTWVALAAGAAALALLLVLLWRSTRGSSTTATTTTESPPAKTPQPRHPTRPAPATPAKVPADFGHVGNPPALEAALEADDPEAACAEITALVEELPHDDFDHTMAESYGYPLPDAPYLWIPIGDVGVAVPAADYDVTIMSSLRADPTGVSQSWPSMWLKAEDPDVVVMIAPGVADLLPQLPGFPPEATALDVFRAGFEVTPDTWRCDPDDLVRSTRTTSALLFKRLLAPPGDGPGRAFFDVGVEGSVLSMRDDGERVGVSHSLVAGGSAWTVQVRAADDETALTTLSLAQLAGRDRPAGAAPLPDAVAEGAAILSGDWRALERWLDAHPDAIARDALQRLLDHHLQ